MQNISADPLFIAIIILGIMTVVLLCLVIWLTFKMRRFLVSFDSKNVGDSLNFVSGELDDLKKSRKEIESYLTLVEKRLRKSVRSVHTVRFNPFKGSGEGGNQSFATALLNEDGSGVIISSLHSRDHTRVFSKPVADHKAQIELSEEEKEALENADKQLKIII